MLNTLFVTSEDAYLALENENIIVFRGEDKVGQYPLQILENVVSFSYRGASPALMGACAKDGVHLCFLTPSGRFLARVSGQSQKVYFSVNFSSQFYCILLVKSYIH